LRHLSREVDHVGIRNADATLTGTRYLADLGHQHIAYLGGTDMNVVRKERITGYQQAMLERNLGEGVIWDSADNKLAGLDSMLALRKAHPLTTAVMCNGDMVAQDAAVGTPPLTTMSVCPAELGRLLARTVLDRINNPDSPVKVTEVSAQLTVRDTTGVPRSLQ